ncbi:MAG: hypothetical protein IKO26_03710 [Paludibacteraceae bacterium]|nr:hypothetical protein [Paludibacteraceae bacterium]
MKKFFQCAWLFAALLLLPQAMHAQQVANSDFEDWSGATFDGNAQPKGWNASHVEQLGLKFNFAHKESGHNGGYCMMVQDQDVGAMGITETSPGYFSLGQPWAYLPSITAINQATAGTYGGIDFKYRPDSMSVWIKRTGSNWDKEDFYLLYYAWTGVAKGEKYKAKNGSCTPYNCTDEESDIRLALNGNECGTAQKATQVSEGMWRERKQYGQWTNIRVPIYYFNNTAPTRMNLIFSASNYPNFRANNGLYVGNSLYVDDIELIYSAKIQKLIVDEIEWRGFDPETEEVQEYALGENATSVPDIVAMRGAGSITNAHGTTVTFPGRRLSGDEITVEKGDLNSQPTVITVKSEDGKHTMTYRIQFRKAASSNAKLAEISYAYTDKDGAEQQAVVPSFSPNVYEYTVALPYGTTKAPVISVVTQEDGQKVQLTQAASVNGTATATVTAANGKTKQTYTVRFSVAQLADNTLKDIQVNGKSVTGFSPLQTVYKVSLPVGTTKMTVDAVSAYPDGAQTITYSPSRTLEGSAIDGATVQISVTTPGNAVAKVYRLNIRIEESSYSYLADLQVRGEQIQSVNPSKTDDNTALDFTPENLTYYVNLKMGTTTLPEIVYTKGDEYQKEPVVTSLGAGVVDGTVRITVTAGNGEQSVYKLVFATEKSEISTLEGITIGGKNLADFQADVTNYTYTLPVGTTELPAIEPVAHDEFQTITVTPGGVNGKTRITVTAGNGNTTIYQITFSVATYSDNTLAGLYLDGKLIDGFNGTKDDYYVNLPKGTTESTLPKVTYELQDANFQKVSEPKLTSQNGEYIYRITVRPLNGESRTYTIHFTIAKATNTALKMIYIDGKALSGFKAATLNYEYSLPKGVSTIPAVTYEKAEESQRVVSVLDKKVQRITVTAESGDKREYTVTFIVTASDNSKLEMIYLDGVKLPGFKKDVLNYEVQLATGTCPAITVDKAPGQQVTITTPYSTGEAKIVVKPEEGAANTYVINFVSVVATSARLKSILVNKKELAGFKPDKMDYTYEYERTIPAIEFVRDYPEQQVDSLWKGNVAWLYVRDSLDNKSAYNITFTRKLLNNNSLAAILVDGKTIDGFKAATLDYTLQLEPGSTYPEVGYTKGDESQKVFFGEIAEGKWQFVVEAENGAQKTYKLQINIKPYSDATLESLSVEGKTIAFEPNKFNYSLELEKGLDLPAVSYKTRKGQVVLNHNDGNSTYVYVTAESGAKNTYVISYNRTASMDASLADILVGGKSLEGFSPEKTKYTYELTNDEKVVPDVFPVAKLPNQTIVTELSRPRSTTKITVTSEGGAKRVYTIFFPVRENELTSLGSLTINGAAQDVEQTEYEFDVPYGTTEPYEVQYTKAHPSQLVEFISAPINGVTKIIVTNSLGISRTYNIRYNVGEPVGENILKKVEYTYTDKEGTTHNGSLVPVKGDNPVDLPFGAKEFKITNITKNYTGQSVIRYDGSIRRSAKMIVISNRTGEEEVVYTITPRVKAYEEAGKLSSLKFKGEAVPNWRPDVYNYLINVTEQPAAEDFEYTAFAGKAVEVSPMDAKKKQITFTVADGETYSVCWYYAADGNPFDFSNQWIKAKYNGSKPNNSWTVPGDCADKHEWGVAFIKFNYITGNEVMSNGNGVLLQTIHGASLAGSVPGMMTTGDMTLNLNQAGNSTSSIKEKASKGIAFRNTPDSVAFWRTEVATNAVTGWSFRLRMSDGYNLGTQTLITGTYSQLNAAKYEHAAIHLPTNPVTLITATMNSAHTENAQDLEKQFSGILYTSALQLRDIHFVYNSDLTKIIANGNELVIADQIYPDRTYYVDVDANYVGIPSLEFEGRVHDQMQTIEWLNDGEWLNGELTAKITNYGENSQDKTEYFVVFRREAVTSLNFSYNGNTVVPNNDTTFINIPYGTTVLPDIDITPLSAHQRFQVEKNGSVVKVTVKAEDGSEATKVFVYREVKNNTATLSSIMPKTGDLVPTFNSNIFAYTITGTEMPELEYERGSAAQTVDLNYGYYGAAITVTAENGSKKTYTITLKEPTDATSGKIDNFKIDGEEVTDFGADNYNITRVRPDYIAFERESKADSVSFTITPKAMTWDVTNSESVKTVYTLTYPTASTNTDLGNILLNGENYADFNAAMESYEIFSDTTVWMEAVAAEEGQSLTTKQTFSGDTVTYSVTVTAQDGKTKKTYTLRVSKPKSEMTTLNGILLDGELLEGFQPDKFDYTVVIPTIGAKQAEPQMPSITYVPGHEGQTVTVTTGALNGKATKLTVHGQTGANSSSYEVTVLSEPSHCAELSGIILNGAAIENFEAGRHFYSVSLHTNVFTFDYTSDDRFQTVTTSQTEVRQEREYEYNFHVQAEDGTESDYLVQIYVENPSSDCQLANITLDGKNFSDFERALNANPPLKFESSATVYDVIIPSSMSVLPEVSAQLKVEGQQVNIEQMADTIFIHVTAPNGITKATYRLNFHTYYSRNAQLKMIYLNGEELPAFKADKYVYVVQLAEGVHEYPDVSWLAGEAVQTISANWDKSNDQVQINVQAEDEEVEMTYNLIFQFTRSSADYLTAIFADGETLPGFKSDKLSYTDSLAVGTKSFPDLSWETVDQWQTVSMDTVSLSPDGSQLVRSITVVAENGRSNTYFVTYVIRKSAVNTLRMLIVDKNQLADFQPEKDEYSYTLTAARATELNGKLPEVDFIEGDEYQTVFVSQAPDAISGKSLGYKSLVTVTAANGTTKTYTIHYPVEMSTDATLNMILLGGKPLSNFDAERFNYTKLEIPMEASIPVVSVRKKEEAQTYEIRVDGDVVHIQVWAEDVSVTETYTLSFERILSANALLRDIVLRDAEGVRFTTAQFPFRSEDFLYDGIILPYDPQHAMEEVLPNMEIVLSDEMQTYDTTHTVLPNGDVQVDVTVTAPNGEDMSIYTLIFHWVKPADAYLASLAIEGTPVEDFSPYVTEYEIEHPYGTPADEFFTAENITYTLSDAEATAEVTVSDGVIFITVTAQDGTTKQTYIIRQTMGPDTNNNLKLIVIGGDTLANFSPDETFYTYTLLAGANAPEVKAEAESENAQVTVTAGDTCIIVVLAGDGVSKKYYYIYFKEGFNDGLKPTANDVLLKRVLGSYQIFVATIRQAVTFSLYDQNGRLVYSNNVPVADANAVDLYKDAMDKDVLVDVMDFGSGLLVDVIPGQIYFYSFTISGKEIIKSGKLMAL